VRPADALALLEAIYRDKLALRQRHVAAARRVSSYEFNNAYQYVINREDVHLAWLSEAIAAAGGTLASVPEPDIDGDAARVMAEDRELAGAFVAQWKDKIAALGNARHQTMLKLMLGETLEQQRFFAQAAAGETDLLGRREGRARGAVLPTRWVE
jgi:predicted transposase YdaD